MSILCSMTIHCTNIRAARPKDASSLAAAHKAAWKYAYSGVLPCLDLERYIAKRDSAWWLKFLLRDPDVIVLSFDDNLIGYATIGENRDHTQPYHGEIMELYVHPDYHGLGFGSKLFRMARKQLQSYGLKGLLLWTLADNDTAIEFYKYMGGQIVAHETDKFGKCFVDKVGFAWRD